MCLKVQINWGACHHDTLIYKPCQYGMCDTTPQTRNFPHFFCEYCMHAERYHKIRRRHCKPVEPRIYASWRGLLKYPPALRNNAFIQRLIAFRGPVIGSDPRSRLPPHSDHYFNVDDIMDLSLSVNHTQMLETAALIFQRWFLDRYIIHRVPVTDATARELSDITMLLKAYIGAVVANAEKPALIWDSRYYNPRTAAPYYNADGLCRF